MAASAAPSVLVIRSGSDGGLMVMSGLPADRGT
jgi:hypothetical protein